MKEKASVLLVDDSAVVRGLFKKLLATDPTILVEGAVSNGKYALDFIKRNPAVDIVLLDLEMPTMDGLTALPQILELNPNIKVIIVSALSTAGSRQTLKALELGAVDYIAKPTASTQLSQLKDEIIKKIKALSGLNDSKPSKTVSQMPNVRPLSFVPPKAIVVGASTGGPNALNEFFSSLSPNCSLPIFIVQHIPKNFSDVLAERISNTSKKLCRVAEDGMIVQQGEIYLAPGDYHMTLKSEGKAVSIKLNQDPQVNYCRPAVDPLFKSATQVYRNALLGIVFTGMGHDGGLGALEIKKTGGMVVVQDEESSVVWGMPGSVVEQKAADYVLPLNQIARATEILCEVEAGQWAS